MLADEIPESDESQRATYSMGDQFSWRRYLLTLDDKLLLVETAANPGIGKSWSRILPLLHAKHHFTHLSLAEHGKLGQVYANFGKVLAGKDYKWPQVFFIAEKYN